MVNSNKIVIYIMFRETNYINARSREALIDANTSDMLDDGGDVWKFVLSPILRTNKTFAF